MNKTCPVRPLYHWTTKRAAKKILKEGLGEQMSEEERYNGYYKDGGDWLAYTSPHPWLYCDLTGGGRKTRLTIDPDRIPDDAYRVTDPDVDRLWREQPDDWDAPEIVEQLVGSTDVEIVYDYIPPRAIVKTETFDRCEDA